MNIVAKVQSFIDTLDEKSFYRYLGGALAGFALLCGLIVFQYYRSIDSLTERISSINDERTQIRQILRTLKQVKKQREEVDAILAKDEGFKLGGYFTAVLQKLKLMDKWANKQESEYSRSEVENAYTENVLRAKLVGLDMKELCELLAEIEQTRRVYIKELEIIKTNKQPAQLDVNLSIATLEPKAGE